METEGAEIIRNRMRERTCEERAKHRNQRYIERRDLTEKPPNELLNENHILAAAFTITSNTGDKIEALKTLKESFINNISHIVTFMKVEGASHALIKHLLSNNSMEQLLAIECCCNLSLGDAKTCFKLAKGATPYLINLLQGLNYNIMNVVLITLGNLSGSGKKTCHLLYTQGLLKSLEYSITIPELRENTAKTLVLFTKHFLNELSEEESISIVQNSITYYDSSVNVQWLLYHFSSLTFIKPLLIKEKMPQRIINYLSGITSLESDNIVSVTAQFRTLAFLTTDTTGITVNILMDNWDITLNLIKFLLCSKYRHLCKELYWLLGNIIRHNSPEIKDKLAFKVNDLRSVITYVPVL